MVLYNETFMDTSYNLFDLAIGIGQNLTYNYMIGNLLLFSFGLIFLLFTLKFDFVEVLAVDCFLMTILAVLLWGGGLIAVTTILFPFVLFIITIVYLLFT